MVMERISRDARPAQQMRSRRDGKLQAWWPPPRQALRRT
jgi:hypothetical protein